MSSTVCTATYHGFHTTPRAAAALWCLNQILQHNGYETSDATMSQGSCSHSVSASAGTHDGGDAGDLTKYDWQNREKFGRLIGFNAQHRWAIRNLWAEHFHWTLLLSTTCSPAARRQNDGWMASYRDGLADNKKSTGFLPDSSRINFLRKDTGRYIANKATAGYSQPGGAVKRKTVDRAEGWTFEPIGVVKIGNAEYLFNATPTFYPAADFNAWVADWVAKKETYRVKVPTQGYSKMWSVKKSGTARAVGYIIKSIGHTTKGTIGVSTVHGTWYSKSDLELVDDSEGNLDPSDPPVVTPPTPPAATSHALTMGTSNIRKQRQSEHNPPGITNWQKGLDFPVRTPLIAREFRNTGVDIITTTEAGSKADQVVLQKSLTNEIGGKYDNWLEGDYFDISQAIIWNTDIYEKIDAGVIDIPTTDHDKGPWVLLEHKLTGIRHVQFAFHLQWRAGDDAVRYNQMMDAGPKILKVSADMDAPVILTGDFNSYKEKAYDGPYKALRKFGFIDLEDTSCVGENVKWPSFNGLDLTPSLNSRQIDRCFIVAADRRIKAVRRKVLVPLSGGKIALGPKIDGLPAWPSDHWSMQFDLVIYR